MPCPFLCHHFFLHWAQSIASGPKEKALPALGEAQVASQSRELQSREAACSSLGTSQGIGADAGEWSPAAALWNRDPVKRG
jgi:hypothetical protein